MNGLNLGEHRTTVLTSEKGRIIDIVTVLKLEDSLILTTSTGNSQG
jgi:glycine cleavage system aminomethyltransferase T